MYEFLIEFFIYTKVRASDQEKDPKRVTDLLEVRNSVLLALKKKDEAR